MTNPHHLKVINAPTLLVIYIPDNKVHGANMGPTWVLSAPNEPHVGPMNIAIRDAYWPATNGKTCTSIVACWQHMTHVTVDVKIIQAYI